ncbi:DUF6265 family protein [Caulobacter sp. CCH9-E1]|uniref:DUF6265 family protein n=1 Tax=Caulobacter sp. CCH9-E1 TaxID=1768768 RepID=UPI000AE14F6F|nr:DUF6265 family protein [Caulobacter sp. CCH9-E1]
MRVMSLSVWVLAALPAWPAAAAIPPAETVIGSRLAGCWEQVVPNGRTIEQWMPEEGGLLLGMSRSVRDGKVREYEFLRIDRDSTGKLRYVAQPSGQAEATFMLKSLTEDTVVFENPRHDFPQRILYKRVDKDTLVARIEGSVEGRARSADFPYRRCAPGN